jgi:hypothetical protein
MLKKLEIMSLIAISYFYARIGYDILKTKLKDI